MKSVLDKDGNFMFTFEGAELNMDDPALQGCSVIEGGAPLDKLTERLDKELAEKTDAMNKEREHEQTRFAELERRIAELESQQT